jgi:ectoine hydroxylase-related dioxygenase (phytanoyl-CoA dioxygenase family)
MDADLPTDFARDGVVYIRSACPELVATLQRAIDWWVAHAEAAQVSRVASSYDNSPLVVSMFLWRTHPEFRRIALDPGLAKVAATLLRVPDVALFNDNLFVKEPGCDVGLGWHHDVPYYPVSGSQFVTLWLPADSASLASGGIEYLAGSHKWGCEYRPTHFTPGAGYYDISMPQPPDIERHRSDYDIVSWDVEPGDCIAHHGLTLQSSQPNSTTHRRRALAVRFTGPDITYVPRPGAIEFAKMDLEPGSRFESRSFPRAWPRPQVCG